MTARVDRDVRRRHLAEALWRVVLREGMSGASVRGVAREAEMSMGSVRHFFATQDELLHFAMREVTARATRRIASLASDREALAAGGQPAEAIAQLLEQVLPFDEERLTEARVWMALSVHGAQDAAIRQIRRDADDAVHGICRDSIAELVRLGLADQDTDVEIETERLWSLLDGLTTHLVVNPERTGVALAAATLRSHLASLAGPWLASR